MPHRTQPMAALLLFTGLNVILVSTITPVYNFVCFLPYWERRKQDELLGKAREKQDQLGGVRRGSQLSKKGFIFARIVFEDESVL